MSVAGGAAEPVSAGTATPVGEDVYIGPGETLTAPTTFLGTACGTIAPATTDPAIAVVERGECFFQDKINKRDRGGIRRNHDLQQRDRRPAVRGPARDARRYRDPGLLCEPVGRLRDPRHRGYDPANCPGGANPALPAVRTAGETLTLSSQFDGWNYVRLFDAQTLDELDQFAIPEALDPAFAEGFGDLSVHEVAVDPQDPSLAYLSYYSGGLVAVQIQCGGTPYDPDNESLDTSTCELVEVGSYLDPAGNNFWGVETFVDENPDSPYFGRTVTSRATATRAFGSS